MIDFKFVDWVQFDGFRLLRTTFSKLKKFEFKRYRCLDQKLAKPTESIM